VDNLEPQAPIQAYGRCVIRFYVEHANSQALTAERAKPRHTLLRGDATGGRWPAGRADIARGRREEAQRCLQWCALEEMAIKYRLKYLYSRTV
jgi:hypothetical protein